MATNGRWEPWSRPGATLHRSCGSTTRWRRGSRRGSRTADGRAGGDVAGVERGPGARARGILPLGLGGEPEAGAPGATVFLYSPGLNEGEEALVRQRRWEETYAPTPLQSRRFIPRSAMRRSRAARTLMGSRDANTAGRRPRGTRESRTPSKRTIGSLGSSAARPRRRTWRPRAERAIAPRADRHRKNGEDRNDSRTGGVRL